MTELGVLHSPGPRVRARQRRRRRRRREAALAAVLALGALLVFMSATATGPRLTPAHAIARHRPKPLTYGTALARTQLNVRLKLPLTSGMLFDVRTGRVLWQRDPDQPLPIASLTKMMTALIVVAHAKPSAHVVITPQAVHFSGSGMGVLPLGKRARLLTLLYGLMLPSGNDAAIALAQHVAGTQGRFVAMMNARAGAMHLGCTHFASPSGIVDKDNYSCAVDLAVLAHAVLEQHLLATIVASRSAVMPLPVKSGKVWLYNNNPLLRLRYPGADGVKTGYTSVAGTCLVAAARRGRRWLGVVLIHSADIYDQAVQLLNAGFAS
jgi:serine-type D-Ala-D-Ala carboxypeptidase (penicillin-binding protein 5/6)